MNVVAEYLPLLNFVFVAVLVPIWNLAKSLKNSKDEIEELTKLNKNMMQELKILKFIVLKYLPDEATKAYVNEQMKFDKT